MHSSVFDQWRAVKLCCLNLRLQRARASTREQLGKQFYIYNTPKGGAGLLVPASMLQAASSMMFQAAASAVLI